jgi:polysaccharide export outer membrane protein
MIAAMAAAQETQPEAVRRGEIDSKHMSTYVLGPEDRLQLWVRDSPEISSRTYLIDNGGQINLPLIGRVKAAGWSVEEFEAVLREQISKYIREPDVTVTILEFRSSPVYVFGAVGKPGIVQLLGPKTLVEVLSMAGGMSPEASNSVFVTRRLEYGQIPVASAIVDPNEEFSIAEIILQDVIQARRPGENIVIRPFDVISIPKRETIYVTGDVRSPGAFQPKERGTLSVLEAISLAGGFTNTARPREARIMRPILGGPKRYEIALDAKDIADGKAADYNLQPGDVLVIPGSNPTNRRWVSVLMDRGIAVGLSALMWTALWNVRR